ncbi:MAG: ORF6N domain-containing protein [Desulfobacteraceae bacterium]|nr:ORF6N domain-containing protein [Desulfobacteraceae bacterium]
MDESKSVVPVGKIENRILLIKGEKVIIDADLAEFYGVPTKRLNEQVKRNKDRFPHDFMFQLSPDEKAEVVANCDHLENLKYSRALPYAFTEHGAIMAAGVLNTSRAIEVSVFIVRAFVKVRQMVAGHKDLQRKIAQIERRLTDRDEQIIELVNLIKQLLNPEPPPKKRRIGY